MKMIYVTFGFVCLLACWTVVATRNKNATVAGGSYRLPTNLYPMSYDLFIQPFIYEPDRETFGTFAGKSKIRFRAVTKTDRITLHQNGLDISDVSITTDDGTEIPHRTVLRDSERDFFSIVLGKKNRFEAGKEYSIRFAWTGNIREDALGLYLSYYEAKDGTTIYMASTQLQATFARSVFPCFDEPSFRSTFTMNIARRTDTGRNYTSMFNAPLLRSEKIDESWTIDIFDTTPEMPSYLVAFFVSDYNATGTGHINGIRYTTYTQPHREEEGTLGHDTGVLALDWLEKNFAPSFKSYLPKIDSVTVPHFDSGAMENWGMVTYNKDFLYKEGRDAIWKPFWIMETVTHELVHQWFGNIVTPSWWGSLWLSEGFASYWMYYITEELNPTMRDSEIRVAHSVQGVMQVEAVTDMHPLTYDPQTPEEIKAGFDFIEYSKGGAIVRMMHLIMGEHFIPALRYYLTKNALRSVEYKDLLQDLDEYASTKGLSFNMAKRMDPWIVQSGYPVVNVTRDGDKLTFSQERFWRETVPQPDDSSPYGNKFDIPIVMTDSREINFQKGFSDILWLERDRDLTVEMSGKATSSDWVVLNPQHMGYYRVNYDVDNWRKLSIQLLDDPNVFDPLLRGTLIDDAMSLAEAGMLNITTALDTTLYLGQELSYPGWRSFARHYYSMLKLLRGTTLQNRFEDFVRQISGQAGRKMTFDVKGDIPPYDTFLRTWVAAIACRSDEYYCMSKAITDVESWMNNPQSNTINVNFRWMFYCAAVQYQTEPYYTFLYEQAYLANLRGDTTEREKLVHAQTCSTNPDYLKWTMKAALNLDHYLAWHSLDIIDWVSLNPVGRELAFDFLVDNADIIHEQVGFVKTMDRAVQVTKYFFADSPDDAARVDRLLKAVQNLGHPNEWQDPMEGIRQTMKQNSEWRKANFDAIDMWLMSLGFGQ